MRTRFGQRRTHWLPPLTRYAASATLNTSLNVAPPPGVSSTQTRPPSSSIISFTIERPSPVPAPRSTLAPKGFKDFYTIVRRHAFAMISDVNSAARVNAHEDRSAFRFGAERVVDQIGENALDPATVATRHDRF